jgi:hypothetical protein
MISPSPIRLTISGAPRRRLPQVCDRAALSKDFKASDAPGGAIRLTQLVSNSAYILTTRRTISGEELMR